MFAITKSADVNYLAQGGLWVSLGAYSRVKHLKDYSLRYALALPTNTRLGWKGLPGKNTLTYYGNPYITAVISFMIQASRLSILHT